MNKFLLAVLLCAPLAAHAGLISVDWKNSVGINALGSYSGVEPLAAAANPDFGAAGVWNDAVLGYLSPETDPSFSNLLDSTGSTTDVGIAFTGQVDTYTGLDSTCPSTLFCDFIYLNSGSVNWTITGLTPDTESSMYFYNYGDPNQGYRVFNMAVDTNGDGTLDGSYTVNAVTGAYAANILSSDSGTISGQMQYSGGQASWSGFQIAQTPEPSSIALFGAGIVFFGMWRKLRA